MNPYSIPPLMAAIVALLLGLLIYFKNRKSERNIAFALLCLSTIVWQLTWTILFNIHDNGIAAVLVKVGYSGIIFLPITIFHFAVKYAEKKIDRIMSYIAYAIGGILLIVLWGTDYYIKGDYQYFFGYYPKASYLHPFYLVLLFILVCRCYIIFNSKLREKESSVFQKDQARYLKMSVVVYSVAATDFLANYGIEFYPVGFIFVVLSLGIIAYTITKHRLMDISVIISRLTAEIISIVFYGTIYLILIWLYRINVSTNTDLLFVLWSMVYGTIVGRTHHPVRLFLQTTSDKLFLRGKYDYYKELSNASARVGRKLSLASILGILYETFHDVVEISSPRIFLPENFSDPQKPSGRYVVYDGEPFSPLTDGPAVAVDSPLVTKLISSRHTEFMIKEINACLVTPCMLEDRLIAFFALGPKLSEDPYTDEDIRLLEVLASQVAIALDHTRSYEKIKNDYDANEKKLYDTERLLARSEKIASMANLIQEYNHEIKTPLAIMKSKIELLDNEGDIGNLNDFKKYMIEQINRASDIVESTLRLSTPTARQEIEINLNDVINTSLQLFPPSGVHLIKELNPTPLIMGDRDDLQTVFINLIKNAVEAMPDGGDLKVSTYSAIEANKAVAYAEVSDTGAGIPEENMEKIFEPFFSTHVTKGRGLGLSIVFRIIREHLGKIEVKSKVGVGSTFKMQFKALKK